MFNNLKNNFNNTFSLTTSAFQANAEININFINRWDENLSFNANGIIIESNKYFLRYQLILGNVEPGLYDYTIFKSGKLYKRGRVDIIDSDGELSCILISEVSIMDANIDLSPNFEIDLEDGDGCQIFEIKQSSL